ncbi:alpha/beta hydrolase [Naasia lichenicola]|uniref:Alpha/beta hydrolase n=1 Tax=Naasia lichenicola TaxID=2565933 RepID=A0A4S4FMI0_9MICO|nr:alpha/beta hydrolase [Naasia lichenicola]THG31619.1 alpha/beta hydrolase [Naasia lichenicola]
MAEPARSAESKPVSAADSRSQVLRDIVFSENLGFRPLTLDLHSPSGSDVSLPTIVFVHGGGWRLGSRRMFVPGLDPAESFGRLTGAGFAVAAIDYRLSGESRFPAPVDDVVAAVDWIRREGGDRGLDASRVLLWGESSGAHLGALAAFRQPTWVRGVVDWYGPSDLTTLGAQLLPDSPGTFDDDPSTREAGLLGGAVGSLPELARAASPALQVPTDAPPFHIAHGTADALMPFAQSEELAAALRAAGVDVEFTAVPGASHFWKGAEDTPSLFDAALRFATRVTA